MIGEQTVGVRDRNGLDALGTKEQKVAVVALCEKEVLTVVATLEDVLVAAVFQRNRLGHALLLSGPSADPCQQTLGVLLWVARACLFPQPLVSRRSPYASKPQGSLCWATFPRIPVGIPHHLAETHLRNRVASRAAMIHTQRAHLQTAQKGTCHRCLIPHLCWAKVRKPSGRRWTP